MGGEVLGRVKRDRDLTQGGVLFNADTEHVRERIGPQGFNGVGQISRAGDAEIVEPELLSPDGEVVHVSDQRDGTFKCITHVDSSDRDLHTADDGTIECDQSAVTIGTDQRG